jgi:transcriptional regulator with XRE-family HTH domain
MPPDTVFESPPAHKGTPSDQLGLEILRERKARGWTLLDLAERAGMSVSAVLPIEEGVNWPREKDLRKILDALNCTLTLRRR